MRSFSPSLVESRFSFCFFFVAASSSLWVDNGCLVLAFSTFRCKNGFFSISVSSSFKCEDGCCVSIQILIYDGYNVGLLCFPVHSTSTFKFRVYVPHICKVRGREPIFTVNLFWHLLESLII